MINKLNLSVLTGLLVLGMNAFAQDTNRWIFLCFGQSNMEGFPGIEEQDKTNVDDRFEVFAAVNFPKQNRTKGNWYPAVPPLCRPSSGIGPADYFGRTMVANLPSNIKLGIVSVAVGGCKIELFELDHYQAYAATAPSWMTNIIKGYDGNPYAYLVATAKLAQKDGVIKGILLHQGESNTGDKEWPGKVKVVYEKLLQDLNLKAEGVPLIAGEVVNADQRGQCASMNKIIDELPKTIPTAHVVSSAGCEAILPDHLHFTPAGYRELGKRYAETMLLLLGYKMVNLPAGAAARNPILHADIPDMAMIRVGDTYYMSSTTMHMSPGLPIMRSKDLVNWEIVSYAYDILDDVDALNLANGKNSYGKGSWASSLRYHDGIFYATTFSGTTGKTYVYTTKDIEHGPWKVSSFKPMLHDHSLFFEDDGRVFMVNGGGNIRLTELTADITAVKPDGFNQIIITNAGTVAGPNIGLNAEGSQLFKHDGKYYLFNITWPRGGMRTVIIHRADKITGPWEGHVALVDKGVAQGGLIDTPTGEWFAYLFRDYGAVGRIPYLVPVKWEDGWPVLGVDGKVPDELKLPANKNLIPGIVASDEFTRREGEVVLPLVWQWNHNPDNSHWSLTQRPGFLRLTTGRVDMDFLSARNTLTQRTIGPECSGTTAVDVSNLKDGDFAGLALLQKNYGLVGVMADGGTNFIVMVDASSGSPNEVHKIPLLQPTVFLKADCNFKERADTAHFFYSLDGKSWTPIGGALKMSYTLPHFMGYRFGLFNYATKASGGYADFDFFHIGDSIAKDK